MLSVSTRCLHYGSDGRILCTISWQNEIAISFYWCKYVMSLLWIWTISIILLVNEMYMHSILGVCRIVFLSILHFFWLLQRQITCHTLDFCYLIVYIYHVFFCQQPSFGKLMVKNHIKPKGLDTRILYFAYAVERT